MAEWGVRMTEAARERELTAEALYTAQIVFLDTPAQKERLEALAKARRVSRAVIGREALLIALPKLEADLRRQLRKADPKSTDELAGDTGR